MSTILISHNLFLAILQHYCEDHFCILMLIFGLLSTSFFSVFLCRNFVNELEKPFNFECNKGKNIKHIIMYLESESKVTIEIRSRPFLCSYSKGQIGQSPMHVMFDSSLHFHPQILVPCFNVIEPFISLQLSTGRNI